MFDESKHILYEGKWYARISSIAGQFASKDFQDALKDVEGDYYRAIKRKGEIGTEVHDAINQYLITEIDDDYDLSIEAAPYFRSFKLWYQKNKPKPVSLEQRLFDDSSMITGQIDGLFQFEGNDSLTIVDYKCSASESPSWTIQGHLYNYLCTSHEMKLSDTVIFLKLNKYAQEPQVFRYKITPQTMQICMNAIEKFHKSQQNAC